jgi:hypothetical protein
VPPLNLYARVRFSLCTFAHETAGAARTRHSLLPLRGRKFLQSSGKSCREKADARLWHIPDVIARLDQATQPRLLGSIVAVSGILDRPVIGERKRRRPSDGYAERRRVERGCIESEATGMTTLNLPVYAFAPYAIRCASIPISRSCPVGTVI